MRESKIENWKDPEYRALQTKKHKQYSEKNRSKLQTQAKSLWANPEYRAKQLAERKARFQDPVFRAKLSVAAQNRRPRAKWIIDKTRAFDEIV